MAELLEEYERNCDKMCKLEGKLAYLIVKNDKLKKILVKLGELPDSDSDSDDSTDSHNSYLDSDKEDVKEVSSIKLSFNGISNLSSITPQQLYDMSINTNIMNMNFDEWKQNSSIDKDVELV